MRVLSNPDGDDEAEAELFKVQSEAEIVEKAEEFNRILATQLEDQRQAHSDEMRRALLENETRTTAMHDAIIAEKDKHNASEKVGWQVARCKCALFLEPRTK